MYVWGNVGLMVQLKCETSSLYRIEYVLIILCVL